VGQPTPQSTDAGANITLTDSTGSSSIETTDTQLKIGVDPSNAVAGSNLRLQVDLRLCLLLPMAVTQMAMHPPWVSVKAEVRLTGQIQ
jgi:hypothetical protein